MFAAGIPSQVMQKIAARRFNPGSARIKDVDVVVDRIVVRAGLETRLADSFRTALNLADGIAVLETAPAEGEGVG